jgi:hypothetical protein
VQACVSAWLGDPEGEVLHARSVHKEMGETSSPSSKQPQVGV